MSKTNTTRKAKERPLATPIDSGNGAGDATPVMSFKEVIAAWLANAEKPRNVDSKTRQELARKLLQSKDTATAWRQFERHKIQPISLLAMVHGAFTFAQGEARRQNPSEIRGQINKVERLIKELQQAIKESPLPRNWGTITEWEYPNLPPVLVAFGWHGMSEDVDWLGYPVSVFGVLDGALELIDDYRKSEPQRLVLREKKGGKDYARMVFVRHLAWQLKRRYGCTLAASLAHVTNAIYKADIPLIKEDVAGIVKTSPLTKNKAFKRGSKALNQ
jgi:hypothetical protein